MLLQKLSIVTHIDEAQKWKINFFCIDLYRSSLVSNKTAAENAVAQASAAQATAEVKFV